VGQAKWIHENLKKTKSDTLNGCQKSSTWTMHCVS
jgi:hypothetical protein